MEQNPPSLTSDERRRLREIEHVLTTTDPELAAAFDSEPPVARPPRAAFVGGVLGLVILATGIISGSPATGVAGFAVAVQSASHAIERCDVVGRVIRRLGREHRRPASRDTGDATDRPGPCPPW